MLVFNFLKRIPAQVKLLLLGERFLLGRYALDGVNFLGAHGATLRSIECSLDIFHFLSLFHLLKLLKLDLGYLLLL